MAGLNKDLNVLGITLTGIYVLFPIVKVSIFPSLVGYIGALTSNVYGAG